MSSARSNTPEHDENGVDNAATPTRNSLRDTGSRARTTAQTSLSSGSVEAPPTAKRNNMRRRYGIRVAADESRRPADVSDSLDDSEVEYHHGQKYDLSRANETTLGDFSANESGIGGTRQAISRRNAAGVSLKDSETRIKKLEAENNELRIECDLWRQQMKPEEARLQVVTISKELIKVRKSNVEFMKLLKEQDSSIKESRRILRRWGHLDPKEEQTKRQNLEQKLESLSSELESERTARKEAEAELEDLQNRSAGDSSSQQELSPQVARLRQMLDDQREDHAEAMYALQRERDELEARLMDAQGGASRDGDWHALEAESNEMRQKVRAREAENEDLLRKMDQLEQTKARQDFEIESLHNKLQHSQAVEESHSRELEVAQQRLQHLANGHQDADDQIRIAEESIADRYIGQIDALRDELAAARLEMQDKAQSIEALERQREDDDVRFEEMELELERAANALEDRVEDNRQLNDELDDLAAEYEKLKRELDEADEDIKALNEGLRLKQEEVGDVNQELQELSEKLYVAEENIDVLKQDVAAFETDNKELVAEVQELRERNERREKAYRDRLAQAENSRTETQEQLLAIERDYQNAAEDSRVLGRDVDSLHQEKKDLQAELEKAYARLDDAVEDLKAEQKQREAVEDASERKLEEDEAKWTRLVEEKEHEIASLVRDLENAQEDLVISKEDVEKLQDALRQQGDESVRIGQTHSTDRYSLELEIDRLKRDLGRAESDLERLRKDLEAKEEVLRDKESRLSDLYFENKGLQSKVAAQEQKSKGLEERVESQQRAVAEAQRNVTDTRAKMDALEQEVSVGERSLVMAEQQIKGQLSERNTLLLTVYQFLGKVLGNATPRKRGEGDLKPFTNFSVFHESLLARLRRITDIQSQFEAKAKTIEDNFGEKFNGLKRQQDSRFRQIDRFETAIKNAVDKQGQWRTRLVQKQNELESLRTTNAELQAQLSSLKSRSQLASPGEVSKLNSMTQRANNAEKRLKNAQNESMLAEERLNEAKTKYAEGEGKWSARIKELETRMRAAEERVKNERQGAKERVAELEKEKQRLQKSLESERERARVLGEIQAASG